MFSWILHCVSSGKEVELIFYLLHWMVSNCPWPSFGVHYFSFSQHQLLIKGHQMKMEEQQFAGVLLLVKESGLGLCQQCSLVCRVLVGRGWWKRCWVPVSAHTLSELHQHSSLCLLQGDNHILAPSASLLLLRGTRIS